MTTRHLAAMLASDMVNYARGLGRLMLDTMDGTFVFDFCDCRIGQEMDPIQTLLIGAADHDVRQAVVAGRTVGDRRRDSRPRHACRRSSRPGAIRPLDVAHP